MQLIGSSISVTLLTNKLTAVSPQINTDSGMGSSEEFYDCCSIKSKLCVINCIH